MRFLRVILLILGTSGAWAAGAPDLEFVWAIEPLRARLIQCKAQDCKVSYRVGDKELASQKLERKQAESLIARAKSIPERPNRAMDSRHESVDVRVGKEAWTRLRSPGTGLLWAQLEREFEKALGRR